MSKDKNTKTYSTKDVARAADIPLPTLHTWIHSGHVSPSEPGQQYRGHEWSQRDLECVQLFATLRRDCGKSLDSCRKVIGSLGDREPLDIRVYAIGRCGALLGLYESLSDAKEKLGGYRGWEKIVNLYPE